MNQEKIGKFISKCRKEKKMTQSELAERLGVSDKSIGNWENGRNMPDLSLFKPLCNELGITINDLMSGEKLVMDKEKFEENIINTIDYSARKINLSNNRMAKLLIGIGIFLAFTAAIIFPSDSSWDVFYMIIGGIISLMGVYKLTKKLPYIKKLLINCGYSILFIVVLFLIDYSCVVNMKQLPRFCFAKTSFENGVLCKNLFYNVYKLNSNTSNEYVIVDSKKEYTIDSIPNVPFNRSKSSINNIIRYKNQFVGNNSNDSNLISSLPLSEYGYTFEIDPDNLGLIINYHVTDWYISDDYYLEKSIVYNSLSIFLLIDNVEYIKYNFSGKTYEVKRENVEINYPNYKDIVKDGISMDLFNKYVEDRISDIDFIDNCFNQFVSL